MSIGFHVRVKIKIQNSIPPRLCSGTGFIEKESLEQRKPKFMNKPFLSAAPKNQSKPRAERLVVSESN